MMAMARVAMLPSLLTLGNFTCGFLSLVLLLHAARDETRSRTLRECLAEINAATATAAGEATEAVTATGAGGGIAVAPAAVDGVVDIRLLPPREREISRFSERANELYVVAGLLLFLGMFFDTLDGRVARLTGTDSKFGAELDSLADASSFGLAPAALVAALWVSAMPPGKSWWGQVTIFAAGYAACAALRLARYNVETGTLDRNYFRGLPSPGAAGCVASTALLLRQECLLDGLWERWSVWTDGRMGPAEIQVRALAVYTLLIGFLMVTRLTFIHVPNKYLSGRRKFTSLVLCVFLIVMLVNWPFVVLCLGFNGYVVWCLLYDLWRRVLRRRARVATPADIPVEPVAAS